MNVVNLGQGWIAISTRSEVYRIKDSNDDGVAETREVLLTHKTAANYPAQWMGGLTLSQRMVVCGAGGKLWRGI